MSIAGNATVGVQAAVATELDSVQYIDDHIDNIQEPYQQLKDGRDESRHGSTSFLPRPIVDDRTAGRLKTVRPCGLEGKAPPLGIRASSRVTEQAEQKKPSTEMFEGFLCVFFITRPRQLAAGSAFGGHTHGNRPETAL